MPFTGFVRLLVLICLTIESLKENIIPFLSNKFDIEYDIVGNDHMTLLILDFNVS